MISRVIVWVALCCDDWSAFEAIPYKLASREPGDLSIGQYLREQLVGDAASGPHGFAWLPRSALVWKAGRISKESVAPGNFCKVTASGRDTMKGAAAFYPIGAVTASIAAGSPACSPPGAVPGGTARVMNQHHLVVATYRAAI
jgi:hypothetical protein